MTAQLDRPVLITGTPRSGKSIIAKVLKQAPEFAYFHEPMWLWSVVPPGREHDRLDRSDVTPGVAKRLTVRCSKAVAAQAKRRYLDNYAYHALAIPFVNCVLPEAKIIHVIRNPFDVIPELGHGWTRKEPIRKRGGPGPYQPRGPRMIYSRRKELVTNSLRSPDQFRLLIQHTRRFVKNYFHIRFSGRRRSYGPRVPGMDRFDGSPSAPEVAAYQWEQMVRIAREDLSQLTTADWLEVRFERLVSDPAAEYRRVAEFAEAEDVEAITTYATSFVKPPWAVQEPSRVAPLQPTQAEWERIWTRVGGLARDLGYSRALEATRPATPDGAT